MAGEETEKNVDVKVQHFSDIFKKSCYPLALDTYQRPYIWGKDKISQMISDLAEFFRISEITQKYYMGTILLHKDKKRKNFYVIDGQQRLTTLLILHMILKNKLPVNQAFNYSSQESVKNISVGKNLIDYSKKKLSYKDLFSRIYFTVITVEEDDSEVRITENLSEDATWTNDKIWILGGRITVLDGVTLTIEPGTVIKGEAGTAQNATALLVARGGTLMAEGTATAPIIFTSVADEITPEQVAGEITHYAV